MDIHQLLLKYWGYNHFRPLQEDIINNVLEGKDTLALLPTGGGKSICFQIPALALDGICIVVSPLIALMKDQVEQLNNRGIKATAIYSGMAKREIDATLDNCIYGNYKFLYVSPERLETELFKVRLEKMNVNLIAIDEAHCISQWGYDFRPAYLNIANLRSLKPDVPVIALTATATNKVVDDIQEKLLFKEKNVLQKSFERKNIAYVVLYEENKLERLLKILHKIKGSSIVYTNTRKQSKHIAYFLMQNGISADYYHAGLPYEERNSKQHNWIHDKTRVIVSTNAFGMGIDKSNVRSVIHLELPQTIEAYFQEAGRAGRDENKAYAILMVEENDRLVLQENIISNYPEIATIKNVYQALANHYQIPIGSALNESYDFNIGDFCAQYNFTVTEAYHSIKFLEKEKYVLLSDAYHNPSRIKIMVKKSELYEFQVKNPNLDALLKNILRSYGGLFEDFQKIDESLIANRLKTDPSKVSKALEYLQHNEIIDYLPQSNLPQLTYLTERLDAKGLTITKETYHDRKENAFLKMESMIYYAFRTHKCRSQILLNYFGEENHTRCGICDVCLERNKLALSDLEFSQVSEQVKTILQQSALPLNDLVPKIKNSRDDKTIKVIQWLIDNEKIKSNPENFLEWRK